MTVVHSWLFNFREINQTALHFFDGNAGISASAFVSFNTRLGTVEQLFRSHTGDDDETKAGVDSRPGSFIRHSSQTLALAIAIAIGIAIGVCFLLADNRPSFSNFRS